MKGPSTNFGDPLSSHSKRLVNEVRLRITQPIHPNFDTDFNIYRFVLNAERIHKKQADVIDAAAKALNNHLRMRKSLKLDALPDTPFEENPIFIKKLMPKGEVQSATDSNNRLLWYIDYATINVEALAQAIPSSQSIKCQFVQFEHMLRLVNKQEERTGKLSGLRHVVDMTDYEINPFTMAFVSTGTLTYYTQLLHYENYPELVSPIEMVNIAKWIYLPYKIARAMMPAGFGDRFRLHDANFLSTLEKDISIHDIPTTLGGKNEKIRCQPAQKPQPDEFMGPKDLELISMLETIYISPRKAKQFHVDVTEAGKKLSWYYSTDGDIFFGVFYQHFDDIPADNTITNGSRQEKEDNTDELEMVYPWLKITARITHESGTVECARAGRYWLVFSNKTSWINKRTVNLMMQLSDGENSKRYHTDGTFSPGQAFRVFELFEMKC